MRIPRIQRETSVNPDRNVRDKHAGLTVRILGVLLATAGFALMVAGAVLAATVSPDGGTPYGIPGGVLVLAGLLVGSLGLWLAGVDFT